MSSAPHFRFLASPARAVVATLLVLASAACEDPGLEPGPVPTPQLLFLSTRDGATDAYGPLSDIYRMNADGSGAENLSREPAVYHHLSVSPDGKRVLFLRVPGCDIWVMNVDGTGQSRLTSPGSEDGCNGLPRWSPDGSKIAFATNRERRAIGGTHGLYDVYVMNADGSNPHNVSHGMNGEPGAYGMSVAGWSPTGQVVFQTNDVVNRVPYYRVYLVNADGTGLRTLFPGTTDHSPAWSPDGSKVVFISERDGNWRLYIMNANGTGERRLTMHADAEYLPGVSGGGTGTMHDYDVWSPDGRQIAFHSGSKLRVVNADGSGLRRLTNEYADFNGWSPDGMRIAFTSETNGQKDVYTVPSGGGPPIKLTDSPFIDRDALWTLR